MRKHLYLISTLVLSAGCAASTYPLNPFTSQLAAQAGLNDYPPSFTEPAPASSKLLQQGTCSWYGPGFHGRRTANGEVFNQDSLTAAHKVLPFGTRVEVTDIASGKKVRVRINDRGPFIGKRILDLSYAAAAYLDIVDTGTAAVELRLIDIDDKTFPDSAWSLEVASFPNKTEAARFLDSMNDKQRSAGLYYLKSPDKEATDYRVRFGPFDCEKSAKSAAETLKSAGLNPSLTREGAATASRAPSADKAATKTSKAAPKAVPAAPKATTAAPKPLTNEKAATPAPQTLTKNEDASGRKTTVVR